MRIYSLEEIFDVESKKPIIGVVHLPPLPGSPYYEGKLDDIINRAIEDATNLEKGGVDGLIIENLFDAPFVKRVKNPLTLASFSIIAHRVAESVNIPVGINILRNSAIEAAAVASVIGAKFIRVNAYVETIASDSGIIEPAAPELLRFIRSHNINIGIFADVHVKHAEIIGKRPLEETIKDAIERGRASAVIITGTRTGSPPSSDDLIRAKKTGARVLIGSGLTLNNIKLINFADGAIIGTFFKEGGIISNRVDIKRVSKLIRALRF